MELEGIMAKKALAEQLDMEHEDRKKSFEIEIKQVIRKHFEAGNKAIEGGENP